MSDHPDKAKAMEQVVTAAREVFSSGGNVLDKLRDSLRSLDALSTPSDPAVVAADFFFLNKHFVGFRGVGEAPTNIQQGEPFLKHHIAIEIRRQRADAARAATEAERARCKKIVKRELEFFDGLGKDHPGTKLLSDVLAAIDSEDYSKCSTRHAQHLDSVQQPGMS